MHMHGHPVLVLFGDNPFSVIKAQSLHVHIVLHTDIDSSHGSSGSSSHSHQSRRQIGRHLSLDGALTFSAVWAARPADRDMIT